MQQPEQHHTATAREKNPARMRRLWRWFVLLSLVGGSKATLDTVVSEKEFPDRRYEWEFTIQHKGTSFELSRSSSDSDSYFLELFKTNHYFDRLETPDFMIILEESSVPNPRALGRQSGRGANGQRMAYSNSTTPHYRLTWINHTGPRPDVNLLSESANILDWQTDLLFSDDHRFGVFQENTDPTDSNTSQRLVAFDTYTGELLWRTENIHPHWGVVWKTDQDGNTTGFYYVHSLENASNQLVLVDFETKQARVVTSSQYDISLMSTDTGDVLALLDVESFGGQAGLSPTTGSSQFHLSSYQAGDPQARRR